MEQLIPTILYKFKGVKAFREIARSTWLPSRYTPVFSRTFYTYVLILCRVNIDAGISKIGIGLGISNICMVSVICINAIDGDNKACNLEIVP